MGERSRGGNQAIFHGAFARRNGQPHAEQALQAGAGGHDQGLPALKCFFGHALGEFDGDTDELDLGAEIVVDGVVQKDQPSIYA